MTQEYILQVLRSQKAVNGLDAAKAILDSFTGHLIGQPISILYEEPETKEEKILFVIGKKNGEGLYCGPEYYDIISDGNNKMVGDGNTIRIFGGNVVGLKGAQDIENRGKYLYINDAGDLTYEAAIRTEADIKWGSWNVYGEVQ